MAMAPKLVPKFTQKEFESIAGLLLARIDAEDAAVFLDDDSLDRVIVEFEEDGSEPVPMLFAKECREWSPVLGVYFFDFGDDVLIAAIEPTEVVRSFFASLQERAIRQQEVEISDKRLRGIDILRGWQ